MTRAIAAITGFFCRPPRAGAAAAGLLPRRHLAGLQPDRQPERATRGARSRRRG
ncbi:MAG: hypothetical protein MZV64_28860 [Ignavibacteriales bacterium]|nr:hypothetical protein [Ignavibacteriales bacterium]